MKWFIEDIKCDVSENGKHAGIVPGSVISSIKYKTNDESKWIHCMDFQGLSFFQSDIDFHDILLKDYISEKEIEETEKYLIGDFNNIDFKKFYDIQFKEELDDAIVLADLNELCECESNTLRLAYYMIILTKCSLENTDICIKEGLNKYVDEIDLNTVSKLWDDF